MSARIDHDRAFELIPWLVNDTLPDEERDAVEAHVRDCVPCRRELTEQRNLSMAVQAQPTVHTSAARGFDRLLEQLDGPKSPALGGARRARGALRGARLAATAAVAAAAAAAFVIFGWPAFFAEQPPAGYETLADSPSGPGAAGIQLDLVFTATLAAEERQRLLDEIGAKVVSGPSAIGRYRVQLAASRPEPAIERLIGDLNADARIRFAGRVLSEGPQ